MNKTLQIIILLILIFLCCFLVFSLGLIILAAFLSFLVLHTISIFFPDFKGWKRDLLNGILIWVIYEGARRIQKICKRFKL